MNPKTLLAFVLLAAWSGSAPALVLAAPDAGVVAQVRGFTLDPLTPTHDFQPFGSTYAGGAHVATADFNGDGEPDILVGTGVRRPALVRVFDGVTGATLRSFQPYGPEYSRGAAVAAGDVNGDGRADIIVGTGSGAPTHVKVFDGRTHAELHSFFAFGSAFTGGVNVAAGDVNGDGRDDIIAGAGPTPNGAPHVKVFDGQTGAELRSFFAFSSNFKGGVTVAGGDLNGDGIADLIAGAATLSSHVIAFDGVTNGVIASFFAYDSGFTGGVRVASADVFGGVNDEIVTGPGPGAAGHVKVFDGVSQALLASFFAFTGNDDGAFVAAHSRLQRGFVQFGRTQITRSESVATGVLPVNRTGGSDGEASVEWCTVRGTATPDADYTSSVGTLTWRHGDTATKYIRIPILQDQTDEPTETLDVTLFGAVGAAPGTGTSARLNIVDDDPRPVVSISGDTLAPEGTQDAMFTVSLDRPSAFTVMVHVEAGGTATLMADYKFNGRNLEIPAGVLQLTRPLHTLMADIVADRVADAGETIVLTLQSAGHATIDPEAAAHTMTITEE